MIFATICSGIGAPETAWAGLGWRGAWASEIDPFASAVLAARHGAPNLGDMTKLRRRRALESADLICAGTPCQSFSVAGLRKGMDDPRGNLALVLLGVLARVRPRWVVWENVPGVLSSSGGRDFGAFLGGLAELGYGVVYRVLDAQYVRVESHPRAVPQRRRRVFVVGYLGDWRRAAAVLLERAGLRGDPAPRRRAGEGPAACLGTSATRDRGDGTDPIVAGTLSARATAGGGLGTDFDLAGGRVAGALAASGAGTNRPAGQGNELDFCVPVAHALRGEGFDASEDGSGRGTPIVFSCKDHGADAGSIAATLRSMGHDKSHANAGGQIAVAYDEYNGRVGDVAATMGAHDNNRRASALDGMAVRRLTPLECERLMGFPDGYTAIEWRGRDAPDGPRYRALGNSMAVNVMRWIGERIAAADALS